MLTSLFNITVISEWVAFIAALLLLNKKTTIWRLFIIVLFITVLAETVGWYIAYFSGKNNAWVFNLLLIITETFFIWMLTIANAFGKRIVRWIIILFLCFAILNLFLFQGFRKYNDFTEIAADLLIFILCGYFFYRLIHGSPHRSLFRYEYFWLANGLLFSSLGSIVLYIFLNSLNDFYIHTHVNIYGYINYVINVLLNISLIIAFICRNRNTR